MNVATRLRARAAERFLNVTSIIAPIAVGAVGATASAHTQTPNQSQDSGQTQDAESAARSQFLTDRPLQIQSLGITIHPPRDADVQAQRQGGKLSLYIAEMSENPRWEFRLQHMPSTLENPTARTAVDDHLTTMFKTDRLYELIDREDVVIGGLNSHICYVQQKTPSDQPYVAGWLLVPNGPQSFIVASILTLPRYLEDVRPLIDASLATLTVTRSEDLALRTNIEIEAGKALLASMTPDRLQTYADSETYLRTYMPGDPSEGVGDREIGWAHVKVMAGKRGSLNPQRDEFNYDTGEHEVGLLVHLRAQMRPDGRADHRHDIEAFYWMSWDMSMEQWTVRATRRQGAAARSFAETGTRIPGEVLEKADQRQEERPPNAGRMVHARGGAAPTLIVDQREEAKFSGSQPASTWQLPDSYLSQPLRWLLPKLLPRPTDPAEQALIAPAYSYYSYNYAAAEPTLSRRIDHWRFDNQTGRWVLITRLSVDAPSAVSTYTADGELVRQTHPDGSLTEPVTIDKLRELWGDGSIGSSTGGNSSKAKKRISRNPMP